MPEPEPAVVTLEPATTAVIRRVVPMARLAEFFDGSFGTLAAAVTAGSGNARVQAGTRPDHGPHSIRTISRASLELIVRGLSALVDAR